MSKRPLKSTDRRRHKHDAKVKAPEGGEAGAGSPLANLFHDRRHPNGSGKKAF